MRKLMAAAVMVLAGAGAAQARTIWDGAYTEAQADRGHTAYMQNCARCHGESLMGMFEIPPLVGRIIPYYSGSNLSVFLDYISTAMPLGRPGSLSPATNADIMAYILKVNEAPAGSKELTADSAKAIKFTPRPRKK
ncbi:MAG: cytochrome c [Alphaproteobacteria bacterium]